MLFNVYHDSPGEHRRLVLAGIASMVTIVDFFLSLAIWGASTTVRLAG